MRELYNHKKLCKCNVGNESSNLSSEKDEPASLKLNSEKIVINQEKKILHEAVQILRELISEIPNTKYCPLPNEISNEFSEKIIPIELQQFVS